MRIGLVGPCQDGRIVRPALLALLPIEPTPSGNGLAMRAARFLAAARRHYEVVPVVVPVAGSVVRAHRRSDGGVLVALEPAADLRTGTLRLLADPRWRLRLGRVQPFPHLARVAAPGWVDPVRRQIIDAFPAARNTPIHVMRSYLAPLGVALAESIGAPWSTLDLDDDDVSFESSRGRPAEAEAFDRLLATFGCLFSAVAAASPEDASQLERRYGFAVSTVPNTVVIPSRPQRETPPRPELLFVGNLTYEPNIEAAQVLVSVVLPRLRQRIGTQVSLTLAGTYRPDGPVAPLGAHPGVHLCGAVPDLAPLYARAAAVVAPLPFGGGTKIKILEAFAHGVPVVTSPGGAAGLFVSDGTHLLIATDAEHVAQQTAALLDDEGLARRLAARAREYVAEHHSPEVADRAVGKLLATAAGTPSVADGAIR